MRILDAVAACFCQRLGARGPAGPICQTHPRIPRREHERVVNVSRSLVERAELPGANDLAVDEIDTGEGRGDIAMPG